jgi:hypothetical protein
MTIRKDQREHLKRAVPAQILGAATIWLQQDVRLLFFDHMSNEARYAASISEHGVKDEQMDAAILLLLYSNNGQRVP